MNSSGKYTRRLTRRYPGLFVILLDQSGSMIEVVEDSNQKYIKSFSPEKEKYTKADVATAAINNIIYELIQSAIPDEHTMIRRKYAYLSIIGYNDSVYPLLSRSSDSFDPIDLAALAAKPARQIRTIRHFQSPEGIQVVEQKRPYWITPDARGNTEMAQAFKQAQIVAQKWLAAPPEWISLELEYQRPRRDCFPPVIINITDAMNNGDDDPIAVTDEIRRPGNGTTEGEVLIFNCHFTKEKGRAIKFPSTSQEVSHLDAHGFAEAMFKMSSEIPEVLIENAKTLARKPITSKSRCYVYNADSDLLIKFLRWGTVGMKVGTGSVGAR